MKQNINESLKLCFLWWHIILPSLNHHKGCLPSMTDNVTLFQTNLSLILFFVCGGIPVVETVITFGVGSIVTRSVNDSNNSGFWKIWILENGW